MKILNDSNSCYNLRFCQITFIMAVVLFNNFPRSGGTILSKCLASLPKTVLISEVNPAGNALSSIREQAKEWYGIDLKQADFGPLVMELYEICRRRGLQLIVRDFTYMNFIPNPANDFKPTNTLDNLNTLRRHAEVKPFVMVRDAIDVWISRLKPPRFFEAYKTYVQEITRQGLPMFKYEDFCREPEKILRRICSEVDIGFSGSFKDYITLDKVTGDNLMKPASRGVRQQIIQPLKRQRLTKSEIHWLNNNSDMIEVNQVLNYPTNYYDKLLEKYPPFWWLKLKILMGKVKGKKPWSDY